MEQTPQRRPRTPEEMRIYRRKRAIYRRKMKQRRIFWMSVLVLLLIIIFIAAATASCGKKEDAAGSSTTSSENSAEKSPEEMAEILLDNRIPAEWNLILVNNTIPLPEDFTVETADLGNGYEMDARVVPHMQEMLAAAKADGVPLLVCSAYRSIDYQQKLLDKQTAYQKQQFGYTEEKARAEAEKVVTKPGHSEHNTGLSADIVAVDYQVLDEGYAETPQAKWLKEHARDYGFILRYPKGKEDVTGIIFEPWHYRYVGVEYASKIEESGLCYEEWYEKNVK